MKKFWKFFVLSAMLANAFIVYFTKDSDFSLRLVTFFVMAQIYYLAIVIDVIASKEKTN